MDGEGGPGIQAQSDGKWYHQRNEKAINIIDEHEQNEKAAVIDDCNPTFVAKEPISLKSRTKLGRKMLWLWTRQGLHGYHERLGSGKNGRESMSFQGRRRRRRASGPDKKRPERSPRNDRQRNQRDCVARIVGKRESSHQKRVKGLNIFLYLDRTCSAYEE